jgi:hypothetical protein
MTAAQSTRSALLRTLDALDDEAFAALASVGLLRRARKDLARLKPQVSETEDAVRVDLGAHQVTFDARGPAHARCTCPAKSVCQHVLAACLHLKAQPTAAAHSPRDLRAELLAIEPGALSTFAGQAALRDALRALERDEPARIDERGVIVIRLADPALELRYAGGGPEAVLSDYRGRNRNKLIVRAVLAYQKAHGKPLPSAPAEAPSSETQGVRELRLGILPKVEQLLCECLEIGLTHLTESFSERCVSLATLAAGAKLHRLSLALTRISEHIELGLERHAQADSARLFAELARSHALVCALRDPESWSRRDLLGEVRSEYDAVMDLELFCAGAYAWQTASGYWGLTTLFWSETHARWFTHSDARPIDTPGFEPEEAYSFARAWAGADTPQALAGRNVRLEQAAANRFGRLSSSSSTRGQVSVATELPEFRGTAFRDFRALDSQRRANLDGIGLAEHNPNADYVVLYPERVLPSQFDDTTQTLHVPLVDAQGVELVLSQRYSPSAEHVLGRLESLSWSAGSGFVAQLGWARGGLRARPLAILKRGAKRLVDNLHFDPAPSQSRTAAWLAKLRNAVGNALASAPQALDKVTHTDRLLGELEAQLTRSAERGTSSAPTLAPQLQRLADAGLSLGMQEARDARDLLRLRYLALVARELLQRG